MKHRVAILGIYHESNTFLPRKTELTDFEDGHLLFGEAIRLEYAEAHHEIGGMLSGLIQHEVEAVPLMFAEATPSGIITARAYQALLQHLLEAVERAGPLDGILAAVHGAAVAESFPDMDGDWLAHLRRYLGKEKPLIATLDPHANVSQTMVDATDALVAYKTNPHLDQRETGQAAAQLMVNTLAGKIRPKQFLMQPPVSISIEQQHTSSSPCRELYALAQRLTDHSSFLSVSILLGFPYADVADMGSAIIVVTDQDLARAKDTAQQLGNYLVSHRQQFVGEKISVFEGVRQAVAAPKPVLLLDMGDNVGGGSPGDGTLLIEALEQQAQLRAFVCLYDPAAVEAANQAGRGNTITLDVGGKTDHRHGAPFPVTIRVEQLTEGVFQETQPRHGGQVRFNMGAIAIVTTEQGNTLMLTSLRIAPFSLRQLTTFGIEPSAYDVIVAKGVHAPVGAYASVCETIIRVDTPGITPADITALNFTNRRCPLYPFEKNVTADAQ